MRRPPIRLGNTPSLSNTISGLAFPLAQRHAHFSLPPLRFKSLKPGLVSLHFTTPPETRYAPSSSLSPFLPLSLSLPPAFPSFLSFLSRLPLPSPPLLCP
eukprot:2746215-Rhodomonas_salina.1